jgi:hypothetical protein
MTVEAPEHREGVAVLDRAPSPSRVATGSSVDRWFAALVLAATLARLAYALAAPMVDVIYRSTDDSYYYFNVARNVTLGQGLTFDGMNATNGFHPLWMLCLLPVYAAFGSDPEWALRAAFVVVTLVAGVAFALAYRTLSRFASPVAAALATSLMLAPILLNSLINGLETGLLLLVLFATIGVAARGDLLSVRTGLRENVKLGVLLGLVFLARLDSAFLILGVLGFIVFRWAKGIDGPPRLSPLVLKFLYVGLASAVLVVPYLGWNLARFGHAVPISGELKTSFPAVAFAISRLWSPHIVFGAMLLGASGLGFLWLAWRRADDRTGLLVALWLGSALHFANALLFMHWAAHWWHFASYLSVTLAVAALVFDELLAGPAWGRVAVAAVVAATLAFGVLVDRAMRGDHHRVLYEAALWSRSNLPAQAVVGMTDSGIFGYFCGRRTVNLDGVINGYEYQAALRDNRLADYLRRCGLTHIADYEVQYSDGEYVIRLPARLYKRPGGALVATPAGEVYSSPLYAVPLARRGPIHFALWEMGALQVIDDARQLTRP